ncbi:KxYKxGKxW signal peptide domain-containing protein [Secundilactobacillus muriivasis]
MMGKNNHQQLVRDNTVVHYKAYKVGKHWVFAGITALTVGAGLLFGGSQQAQAATTEASDPTTGVSDAGTSSDIQGKTVTLNATSTADTNATAKTSGASDETDANADRINTANSTSDGSANAVDNGNSSDQPGATATSATSQQPSSDTTVTNSAVDSINTSIDANDAASVNVETQPDNQKIYKTPTVKSGVTESATIAPTTDTGSNAVTTSGTEFTLKFTAAAGDKIEVYVDGADTDSPLFDGAYRSDYMSVSSVAKATMGVTTSVHSGIGTVPSITNDITQDGTYAQPFNLKLNNTYTQYSPTATTKSTVTVDKKIVVNINGVKAADYTYSVNYNVAPLRLLESGNYNPLTVYSDSPVTFILPPFGLSDVNQSIVATSAGLNKLDAKTAEFRVAMPDGFKLDETATAALNSSKSFNIVQVPSSSDILVQYDLADTTNPVKNDSLISVTGSFTKYVADTSVTASAGNIFTVVTNGGETYSSTSTNLNVFNYKNGNDSSSAAVGQYDYATPGLALNTEYISVQRAGSDKDTLNLALGISNYHGPAMQNATSSLSIPKGFTTQSVSVNVPASLLTATGRQNIPYELTYSDGTKLSGVLTSGTNAIAITADKTVQSLNYQFDVPATTSTVMQSGRYDSDSGSATARYFDRNYDTYTLPVTSLTVTVDSSVQKGNYQFPVIIAGTDTSGQPINATGTQTVNVIDSTYVTTSSISAKNQSSTSAGENLTAKTVSYASATPQVSANRKLSDGTTSTSTQPVDLYLNQPIIYLVAPAQTHLITNEATLINGLPGVKLTKYTTTTGLNGYKIDLTQATRQSGEPYYRGSGTGNPYRDSQTMGVTGVFNLGNSDSPELFIPSKKVVSFHVFQKLTAFDLAYYVLRL